MTQFNSKINLYQAQPHFKASPSPMPFFPGIEYPEEKPVQSLQTQPASQLPAVQLPDIYYQPDIVKKKSLVDKIKKADVMDIITPWFEYPLLMIGTCFGLSYGVDAFNKSCNKEYEKSILGKSAKLGDRIAQSKMFDNKVVHSGEGFLSGIWKKISGLGMKNSIVKAMVETPTKPENAMPKSEVLNTKARVVEKFKEALKEFKLVPSKYANDGKEIFEKINFGDFCTNEEIVEGLKKDFGVTNLREVANDKLVARHMLKQTGFSEEKIVSALNDSNPVSKARELIIEKVFGSKKEMEKILHEEGDKYFGKVVDASKELSGLKIKNGKKLPFTNKSVLTSEYGFQEIFNRGWSISGGAKTNAGKYMAKFTQWLHKGLTFGGTKATILLWVAPIIARTLVNTHKAEKNEKVGTFMDGLIMATSWVFTFPLILKAIHAFGGAQYAGMGKEKVEQVKKLINDFNAEVREGKFKSFKEWKNARKIAKDKIAELSKVKNQGFVTETIRKISKFTKSDLMKLERYQDRNILMNFVRNTPAKIKNFAWSAGRFGVFMFIGMPFVDKIINKVAGALFGNHYDGMAEKENQEAKERQEEFTKKDLEERLYNAQAIKTGVIPNPEAKVVQEELQPIPAASEQSQKQAIEQSQEQVIEQPQEQAVEQPQVQTVEQPKEQITKEQPAARPEVQKQEQVINPQQNINQENKKRDNYTYIPSQENLIKTPVQPVVNKYIPSQKAADLVKTFDNSGLESALRKADRAEQRAMQILAGKFPN